MPLWPFSRKTTPKSLLSPPSKMEAKSYYAGLPSCPVLVARTGTSPWAPEANKELRSVENHAIKEAWEGKQQLRIRVLALLESMKVNWSSIDVVRIGNAQEQYSSAESFFPVILWIGVVPASLSGHDGVVVASRCREILVEHDITDVDVEIRELDVIYV